jgi:hypothetical protein
MPGARRERRRAAAAIAVFIALVTGVAGCGGGSDPPAGKAPTAIHLPGRPSAADCGFAAPVGKGAARKKTKSPPAPGVYRYAVAGTQAIPGSGVRVKNLPPRGDLYVAPSRRHDGLVCFTVQRRFSTEVANTSTYVIRGNDVYLVALRIQALGESHLIHPDPPVLTVSDEGSSWSGRFGGSTAGSYQFSGLGKRTFRVGSRPLRAVGISSVVSYRGAVAGSQRSTTWVSLRHEVVVAEAFRSRQLLGVSSLRLRSRSHLLSLDPDPLPARHG